jgi:hypothetical protein
MLCTRNRALWHIKTGSALQWRQILWKRSLGFALVVSVALSGFSSMAGSDKRPKDPPNVCPESEKKWFPQNAWPGSYMAWPNPNAWNDGANKWFEATSKRLEDAKKGNSQNGSESELIYSKTSDLLNQTKQACGNPFRFDRLLFAANALLDAGDSISRSRKTNRLPQDKDIWGFYGMILQGCYFRVQQADFLALMSHDKNSEKYVKAARSLYQQARSAYDARDYEKSRFLAEASQSIVLALESVAQAATPIPEPPHFPK